MKPGFAAIDSLVFTKNICYVNIDVEDFNHQYSQSIYQTCLIVLNSIDVKMVALNFENIKSLSTSGIKSLLDIYYNLVYCSNIKLRIYNANSKIQEIFQETTLDTILCIN